MKRYARVCGILTLFFVAVFLWGCDQSSMTTENPKTIASATSSGVIRFDKLAHSSDLSSRARDLNQKLEVLSIAVAEALANKEVRARFHKAVMKRFDDETNVLWMNLEASTEQTVLSSARAGNAPTLSSMQGMRSLVAEASDALGGPLHLYWAEAENFDGSRAPLVTFTPVGLDADRIERIEAFDARGNVHVVSGRELEKMPVVIIAGNERTDAQGNLLSSHTEGANGGVGTNEVCLPPDQPPGCYLPPEPCPDCGGGGGDDGDGGGDDDNVRDLRLEWVQFFSDHEGPFKGEPEFRAKFVHYEGSEAVPYWNYAVIPRVENIFANTGTEWPVEQKIFNWYTDDYRTYFVKWYEYDGDTSTITVNLGAKNFKLPGGGTISAGVELSFEDKDDLLGEATIHVPDFNGNDNETFNTNDPNFNMTLQ